MSKTLIIFGHGPGISDGVARRFGREGYSVAVVARNAERLKTAVGSLEGAGVKARAFPGDVENAEVVKGIVRDVRAAFGPISTLHWNAYAPGAGDLLSATPVHPR